MAAAGVFIVMIEAGIAGFVIVCIDHGHRAADGIVMGIGSHDFPAEMRRQKSQHDDQQEPAGKCARRNHGFDSSRPASPSRQRRLSASERDVETHTDQLGAGRRRAARVLDVLVVRLDREIWRHGEAPGDLQRVLAGLGVSRHRLRVAPFP